MTTRTNGNLWNLHARYRLLGWFAGCACTLSGPLYAGPQSVKEIRVDGENGSPTPAGHGDSWGLGAYLYLQDALARADVELLDFDLVQIWVAATPANNPYRPDKYAASPNGSLDPSATFLLRNSVEIYGGFAGDELILEDRDPVVYVTVLSGDFMLGGGAGGLCPPGATGSCFQIQTTPGCGDPDCCNAVCEQLPLCCLVVWDGNCALATGGYPVECAPPAVQHVLTASEVDATAKLDGFTVTGGQAVGVETEGGGMLVDNASPRVIRCIFQGNHATDRGGAVSATGAGSLTGPIFVNCKFLGNTTSVGSGGAVHVLLQGFFTNCLFAGNIAGDDGGAIKLLGNFAEVTIKNCTFSGNTAQDLGGGISKTASDSSLTVANCVLWGNLDSTGTPSEQAQIHLGAGVTADVDYSCVQGLTGGLGGTGNIGSDPLADDPQFLSPAAGDYRLQLGSPCNDAGLNLEVASDIGNLDGDNDMVEPTPLDLALTARFANDATAGGTRSCTGAVDMGAYENADCQPNGTRDELELAGNDADGNGVPDDCQDCNGNEVFDLDDIAGCNADPACSDCNANGIPDGCEIADACATDKNDNGVPDGCECSPELVDIVFIVDVSESMFDDLDEICAMAQQVFNDLRPPYPGCLDVRVHYLRILPGTIPPEFNCTPPDPAFIVSDVVTLLGTDNVPGDPGGCGRKLNDFESWGPATAMIAHLHAWRPLASRIIVPVSDEGACKGDFDGCGTTPGTGDLDSIDNAITLANLNNVFAFPVTGKDVTLPACVRFLAEELGSTTQGQAFHADDFPPATAYADIGNLLVQELSGVAGACNSNPCPYDLASPDSPIEPDCVVGINDFLILLQNWGPCADCCECPWDVETDITPCEVHTTDFLGLLQAWGPCPANCVPPGGGLQAGVQSGTLDLTAALNAIGFADLEQYHAWVSSSSEPEAYGSAWDLLAALVGGGGGGE